MVSVLYSYALLLSIVIGEHWEILMIIVSHWFSHFRVPVFAATSPSVQRAWRHPNGGRKSRANCSAPNMIGYKSQQRARTVRRSDPLKSLRICSSVSRNRTAWNAEGIVGDADVSSASKLRTSVCPSVRSFVRFHHGCDGSSGNCRFDNIYRRDLPPLLPNIK